MSAPIKESAKRYPELNPTAQAVLNTVSGLFAIEVEDLVNDVRRQHIVDARWLTWFVYQAITNDPDYLVARIFDRDHTSIIHAWEVLNRRFKQNPMFQKMFERNAMLIRQLVTKKLPVCCPTCGQKLPTELKG
ncbi:MAG: hypothetical protein JST51_01640 [Armatimonadetes bacterium]|nr:hypothetical protein [Armatimonadota bacterium]